jgi:PHD-finger
MERLRGRLRVRPREFVDLQLQYIRGKLNENLLPTFHRRRVRELNAEQDVWRPKKIQARYASKVTATKVLRTLENKNLKVAQSGLATKQNKEHVISDTHLSDLRPSSVAAGYIITSVSSNMELSDTEISAGLSSLRENSCDLAGMEHCGLGQYVVGMSLPRFSPAGEKPFVQILNVGDHWVCVTNKFSSDPNVVYWYDSLFTSVRHADVMQLSSILRSTASCAYRSSSIDNITIQVRVYDNQPPSSRLCGYYAMAAAIAICNNIDPTGVTYHVSTLVSTVNEGLKSGILTVVPPASSRRKYVIRNSHYKKLYCVCSKPWQDLQMVECSKCNNWYHTKCVSVSIPQLKRLSMLWLCAQCANVPNRVSYIDIDASRNVCEDESHHNAVSIHLAGET